jgi:glyoxylase I family protein
MLTQGIHHVSLTVDELDPAVAFYRRLGLESLPRPDLGIPGAWLGAGDQQVHLIELADAGPHRVGDHVAFGTADVDAAAERLRADGLEVDGPTDVAPAGRQAFVKDPSGNMVELQQPFSTAAHRLDEVGLDQLETARWRRSFTASVHAPIEAVWDALTRSPATWSWYPRLNDGGFLGEPGVGAQRWVSMGAAARYEETILVWDRPTRWAYRVDGASAPLARALVESWDLDEAGERTDVTWTFAATPRAMLTLTSPLASATMGRLFRRAMANLSDQLLDDPGTPAVATER